VGERVGGESDLLEEMFDLGSSLAVETKSRERNSPEKLKGTAPRT